MCDLFLRLRLKAFCLLLTFRPTAESRPQLRIFSETERLLPQRVPVHGLFLVSVSEAGKLPSSMLYLIVIQARLFADHLQLDGVPFLQSLG